MISLSKSNPERSSGESSLRSCPRLLFLASHAIQYQAPLLRYMAKDPRFDIEVALCSDHGATTYRDAGFGQEVKWDIPLLEGYEYQVMRNLSPFPNPSTFWGLINPGIIGKIWSGRFDAVMIQAWSSVTAWMAIFTAMVRQVPIILKPEASIHSPTTPWKQAVKRWVLSSLFRKASMILASGRYGSDFFESYGVPKEKLRVAPYAVDNDFFLSKAQSLSKKRKNIREKIGIPEGVTAILYVGKLYAGKRPLDLLKAFSAIDRELSPALVFVGDGALRPTMEQEVKEQGIKNVFFAGFRNQSELPEYFASADIFVLPSALETWGLVVNEAMCFNLPVIVTDRVGASGDLVKHGENGYIYGVGEVSQLAEHLTRLVQDVSLRKNMGEASLRLIQTWSYREDVDVIAQVLDGLVSTASCEK